MIYRKFYLSFDKNEKYRILQHNIINIDELYFENGALNRNRTHDIHITNVALYQLSYKGIKIYERL